MKTMLACDYVESKVVFPIGVQPKIDGVRGLTPEDRLVGRSLKTHKNKFTTQFYSKPEYLGFDGELAADHETHPDLCRITSSAVGTIEGMPFTMWHLFDALNKHVVKAPYRERHAWLVDHIDSEHFRGNCPNAVVVPMVVINTVEDLRIQHSHFLDLGYEGTILRNLDGRYKDGRSTVLEGLLLRIKDFIEAEFMITSLTEGDSNENKAQINELGNTFRSSHQENKVPNGMLGSFQGIILNDVIYGGKVVLPAGERITVSPGNLDHRARKAAWENPDAYIDKVAKFKFFPKGIKDKPRFPTFVSLRSKEDM